MLTSDVQLDERRELVLSVSGLEPHEIHGLWEWFCCTKPIGPSVRVVAPPSSSHAGFCVVAAGNEPGAGERFPAAGLKPREAIRE
jgi:hypothetical protein